MNAIRPIVLVGAMLGALVSPARAEELVATTVKPSTAIDRLQLESSEITGNRELPKVMSIVPWKAAEPPAGPDRPLNSLVEDVLRPIDRDEFRREIGYVADLRKPSEAREPASAVAPAVHQSPAKPEVNSPGATRP
jgi:hypothetical protein